MSYRKLTAREAGLLKTNGTTEAAKMLGMTRKQVKSYRRWYGIKSPLGCGRQVKFAAEDIAQMMMLRCSGFSLSEIAKLKGCSHAGVWSALKSAEKHGMDKYPRRVIDKNWIK